MTDSDIERGAAEDASGTPVTPTDIEASRTPPSQGSGESGAEEDTGVPSESDSDSLG